MGRAVFYNPGMNPLEIITKYYPLDNELRRLLLTHSEMVARKAREVALASGRNDIDMDFLHEAALLHDIGIFLCDAPDIFCTGFEPYIRHGILGADIMRKEGYPRHALVCERHTGAGLTIEDIERQNLPLPHRDMCPQSIEEKIVCYADKFYSKSGDLTCEKSLEKVETSMARHGTDVLRRFRLLQEELGVVSSA